MNTQKPAPTQMRSLAQGLADVLQIACQGRLGQITWFKADWQRGGAATGTAKYKINGDTYKQVVVKLPVVQRELLWTRRLQDDNDENLVIPKLYASGEILGGYDMAWIVIERFEHGPLGLHWFDEHISHIAQAAARFHKATSVHPIIEAPNSEDWNQLVHESQDNLKINVIEHSDRWKSALKTLRGKLKDIVSEWNARSIDQWLHGDLHLANAMSRVSIEQGPVSLIDLAEVRPGHWIEDAIYLERQLWANPSRLKAAKPVRAMARARKELGLQNGEMYPRLATIRRALLAGTALRFLKNEGHPRYLEACLNWLERSLAELK
ncbi:MAG: phosphotransferase [Planctomycetes bacterium]|nr:phosphotransferase [Planctomycetota bacterium]